MLICDDGRRKFDGLPPCSLNMFSLLNNVPDDVEIQFQKNVTFEDEQFVLSGNKLSAIESSLLVLAPDLSPANKLTATESSTLLPVPPILINSKVLPEPHARVW